MGRRMGPKSPSSMSDCPTVRLQSAQPPQLPPPRRAGSPQETTAPWRPRSGSNSVVGCGSWRTHIRCTASPRPALVPPSHWDAGPAAGFGDRYVCVHRQAVCAAFRTPSDSLWCHRCCSLRHYPCASCAPEIGCGLLHFCSPTRRRPWTSGRAPSGAPQAVMSGELRGPGPQKPRGAGLLRPPASASVYDARLVRLGAEPWRRGARARRRRGGRR